MTDRLPGRNVPVRHRCRAVRPAWVEDRDRHVAGCGDESLVTVPRFNDDGQAVADAVAVAIEAGGSPRVDDQVRDPAGIGEAAVAGECFVELAEILSGPGRCIPGLRRLR